MMTYRLELHHYLTSKLYHRRMLKCKGNDYLRKTLHNCTKTSQLQAPWQKQTKGLT